MKRRPTERENHTSDKGFMSKIHRERVQLNNRKTSNAIKTQAEDLNNTHFTREDAQMASGHMKRWSVPRLIREPQIRTAVGIASHLSERPLPKSQEVTSASEDTEIRGPSRPAGGNVNWCPRYGNQHGGASEG